MWFVCYLPRKWPRCFILFLSLQFVMHLILHSTSHSFSLLHTLYIKNTLRLVIFRYQRVNTLNSWLMYLLLFLNIVQFLYRTNLNAQCSNVCKSIKFWLINTSFAWDVLEGLDWFHTSPVYHQFIRIGFTQAQFTTSLYWCFRINMVQHGAPSGLRSCWMYRVFQM